MSSYRQLLYHIVFRTKDSKPSLCHDYASDLYAYIGGIIRSKNSKLYKINGIEDHIHLLTDIHPSIALADFVRDVKSNSSLWIKTSGKFPEFEAWSEGYAALSCSYLDTGLVIDYIRNQHEHHKKSSFRDEYRKLLTENGVLINEQYFP
ncbi:MAG: IS200/IS605 family transposase [Bacteroidales bacterium]|jgi:REP element-mobilizing transposase RayT|nr:IS200/IS605 family transposase [Bacteroidales bacterium]